MKKVERRGLYCTKHKRPCEDAYILINSLKGCAGGVRCDCPKCEHSAKVTEDGARAIQDTAGGFSVKFIKPRAEDGEK